MARETKAQEAERNEAIETLRRFGVVPGATIYTSVSRIARSGMSRLVHCYIVCEETYNGKTTHEIQDISGLVANAIGWKRDHQDGGIKVSGCGMDMCFHTVYTLGQVMFPNGGPRDKSERRGARDAGDHEPSGGYLLRKRDL